MTNNLAFDRASATSAVEEYLARCRTLATSGSATDELSYYTDINTLLRRIGEQIDPKVTTIPEPTAINGAFPDVTIFEESAKVAVAPVEVKPETVALHDLLSREQPKRYAKSFGGGDVLISNLREIAWARLDEHDNLVELDRVVLTTTPLSAPRLGPDAGQRLHELLVAVCGRRTTISEPEAVACLLAYQARLISQRIRSVPDPRKLLSSVASSMHDALGINVNDNFFVPTIAQTLVYGLFSVWLESSDPIGFEWVGAQYGMKVRVIQSLYTAVVDPVFISECDLMPQLEATARVLNRVDREKFQADFNLRAIEYFYEPFLTRFDPELRDRLGVWYTPHEIAEYQVRRIHHHLQNDLGIADGIASDEVLVLDPAVGTGTYLRAVLDKIYSIHRDNGESEVIAASRTLEAALSRVIGFEILSSALVIAHLHIAHRLEVLGATVPPDRRLRIYLSNSLRGWGSGGGTPPTMALPGLEEELKASSHIKAHERVLVMCGNPPYEGFSAAESVEEQSLLSNWILPLWPVWGIRKHRLGDLYIRFWRVAVAKIAEQTGRGVISFITNRKWLGGRSFPAMRETIVRQFDHVFIDDLHGDVHEHYSGDGSIFTTATAVGIQRGVAITTLVKTPDAPVNPSAVHIRDLRGSGDNKRAQLECYGTSQEIDEGFRQHYPTADLRWKLIDSAAGDAPGIDEYFDFHLSGVQTVREEAVLHHNKNRLISRMRDYFDRSIDTAAVFRLHPGLSTPHSRYDPPLVRQKLLSASAFDESKIVRFLYKPFDERYMYWETKHKLLNEARANLLPAYLQRSSGPTSNYVLVPNQLAICAPATARRPGSARPPVTSAVPSFEAVDPNCRVFPLYRPPNGPASADDQTVLELDHESTPQLNISVCWLRALENLGIETNDDRRSEVVFFALVAIMYSPEWVSSIGTDNDDFPPVPLPSNPGDLLEAAQIGLMISRLSDVSVDVDGVTTGSIQPSLRGIGEPSNPPPEVVMLGNRNKGGTYIQADSMVKVDANGGWDNVPPAVWEFSVGGFQVLSKWLGYRHRDRGYIFTHIDLIRFTHLCRRISAILELQPHCDRLYQSATLATLEAPVHA